MLITAETFSTILHQASNPYKSGAAEALINLFMKRVKPKKSKYDADEPVNLKYRENIKIQPIFSASASSSSRQMSYFDTNLPEEDFDSNKVLIEFSNFLTELSVTKLEPHQIDIVIAMFNVINHAIKQDSPKIKCYDYEDVHTEYLLKIHQSIAVILKNTSNYRPSEAAIELLSVAPSIYLPLFLKKEWLTFNLALQFLKRLPPAPDRDISSFVSFKRFIKPQQSTNTMDILIQSFTLDDSQPAHPARFCRKLTQFLDNPSNQAIFNAMFESYIINLNEMNRVRNSFFSYQNRYQIQVSNIYLIQLFMSPSVFEDSSVIKIFNTLMAMCLKFNNTHGMEFLFNIKNTYQEQALTKLLRENGSLKAKNDKMRAKLEEFREVETVARVLGQAIKQNPVPDPAPANAIEGNKAEQQPQPEPPISSLPAEILTKIVGLFAPPKRIQEYESRAEQIIINRGRVF